MLFSAASLILKELEPGLAAAKSARTLDPEAMRAHALVWAHLAALGQLEEAVASAEEERAIADDADDTLVWFVGMLFHLGDTETARAVSALVQRLYPGSAEPHEVEGLSAMDYGRYREAEAAFRRALALEPESAGLHASLALALDRQWRRSREAREAALRALAIDPLEHRARHMLESQAEGRVHAVTGLLTLAIALAAASPTLMGSMTNRWMVLATVLCPLLTMGGVYLFLKPYLRTIAPGLAMGVTPESDVDPGSLAFLAGGLSLIISVTIHTIQAWLEIWLHRELFAARWPGAVTVTVCAVVIWGVLASLFVGTFLEARKAMREEEQE